MVDNSEVQIDGFSNLKTPYRLIYYINVKQTLGDNRPPQKTYYLGLQTTYNGKNLKRKIEILTEKKMILHAE